MKKILSVLVFIIVCTVISGQEKFTDKRDGNVYRTITFSGVTWMSDNLKFKAINGAIYLDNDTNNIPVYGVLYDWKAAVAACPAGWHLPTGNEFRALSDYFEQKASWGKNPSDPNAFNIQLGGMQDYEGVFSEMDESGYYWTSTEYSAKNAEYFSYLIIDDMPVIDISRQTDIGDIHGTEKTNRYSVRCVKK
jgi:uncharacterized protein (TIGR02145 family)